MTQNPQHGFPHVMDRDQGRSHEMLGWIQEHRDGFDFTNFPQEIIHGFLMKNIRHMERTDIVEFVKFAAA